jgi:hypothetical protein
MSSDWIPAKEQDLVELCEKWKTGLELDTNLSAFGWNSAECIAALGKINAFLTARAAYETDNSTAKRLTKDEAKTAAVAVMREFANTSIRYNKHMTDEDKLVYGIRPKDTNPTPETPPVSHPDAEPDTSVIRQITIHFRDSVTKKRGKPDHVHGAEIRWALLDHAPAGIDELIHSDFDTASPFTLTFGEEDRGKRVYFCLRWETHTNLKGPFSEIYMAVIP